MIDVRAGGPGEVEIQLDFESGVVNWGMENLNDTLIVWLDDKQAYDLAQRILDCLQAKDDAKREV